MGKSHETTIVNRDYYTQVYAQKLSSINWESTRINFQE